MKSVIGAVCLLCGCLAGNLYASADHSASSTLNPYAYFNVYSLNNIGSSGGHYHSDIQGTCGAGGDVYFSSFSLDGMASQWGYVLHTGGSASLTGSYRGSIDIGGNLSVGSLNIDGSVRAGGNVSSFSGGTIYGDVSTAGNATFGPSLTVFGTVSEYAAYQPLVNHNAVGNYFLDQSSSIAAMSATGGYVNNYGGLVINAQAGINVIDISGSVLQSAWGVTINAPEDAIVYFNVGGQTVQLNWLTWQYTGGISAADVLLNFEEATTLVLNGGGVMNVLAPLADTTFTQGQLTGNLIVGNLSGSGEVHVGNFGHGNEIPEPATLVLLSLGGICVMRGRSRRQAI